MGKAEEGYFRRHEDGTVWNFCFFADSEAPSILLKRDPAEIPKQLVRGTKCQAAAIPSIADQQLCEKREDLS